MCVVRPREPRRRFALPARGGKRNHAAISSASPRVLPLEQPSVVVASAAMTDLLAMAARAAESPAKVLITGESGVGKDVVARYIHSRSSRRLAPFVAVNVAGVTETLLESELFGHVKGSFTGAYRDKRGKLQLAHRGTLFLDEVGEMSLRMQALLLRFLENGEIQAVGSDETQARVDVRVIAATNRNLNDLVAAGQFREDLLYRLRVIHLHVPPLRERTEDVQALMQHFLAVADRDLQLHGRGAAGAADLPVARQRPRAPQRRRTAGLVVGGGRRRGRAPARLAAQRTRPADAGRRSPQPGRRRVVRRARHATRVILGARLSDVPGARPHAPRSARARAARPARVGGPLQVAAGAVRHVDPRLSPLHELPGRPWLWRRRPRIPWRSRGGRDVVASPADVRRSGGTGRGALSHQETT